MKTLRSQRRLSSYVLGAGRNRVWFDPLRIKDIQDALTRSDIEELIKDNAIKAKKKSVKKTKHKKRKKNVAHVKKKLNFRKRDYMLRIRKLRKFIKNMKNSRKINREEFYQLRKMAKSGQFPDLRHLIEHMNSLKQGINSGSLSLKKQKTN